MAYEYQHKYPREKLHHVVLKYVTQLQVMGRLPNRGISFCSDGRAREAVDTFAWMLDAARTDGARDRYVLLPDGDVWHDARASGMASDGSPVAQEWLAGPNDDLVTLLARSLSSAQRGGDAYLAHDDPQRPVAVADRRSTTRPHAGPDRRGRVK